MAGASVSARIQRFSAGGRFGNSLRAALKHHPFSCARLSSARGSENLDPRSPALKRETQKGKIAFRGRNHPSRPKPGLPGTPRKGPGFHPLFPALRCPAEACNHNPEPPRQECLHPAREKRVLGAPSWATQSWSNQGNQLNRSGQRLGFFGRHSSVSGGEPQPGAAALHDLKGITENQKSVRSVLISGEL